MWGGNGAERSTSPWPSNAANGTLAHVNPSDEPACTDPAGAEQPIFDPAMLEGLLAFGDEAILRRVVATFRDATDAVPRQIGELVERREWGKLAFAAHSLKSGSGVMGLVGLSRLASDLEASGKLEDIEGARAAALLLPELYEQSCDALREFAEAH